MTINKKIKKFKILVGAGIFGVLLCMFGIKYFNYSVVVSDRNNQIEKLDKTLSKVTKEEEKIIGDIGLLKIDKEKRLSEGVDLDAVKKDINTLLLSIRNITDVKLVDVNYYKDYNNLLAIKMQIVLQKNEAENIANLFKIKKILAMDSVKKTLNLYGDYKISENNISFFSVY